MSEFLPIAILSALLLCLVLAMRRRHRLWKAAGEDYKHPFRFTLPSLILSVNLLGVAMWITVTPRQLESLEDIRPYDWTWRSTMRIYESIEEKMATHKFSGRASGWPLSWKFDFRLDPRPGVAGGPLESIEDITVYPALVFDIVIALGTILLIATWMDRIVRVRQKPETRPTGQPDESAR